MKLNQRHDQVTPLHRAVTKGHLAAVQRLVAAGAKLLKDREGPDGGSWSSTSWDLMGFHGSFTNRQGGFHRD